MHKYPLSNVLVSDYSHENNTVHDITKIKIKERFSHDVTTWQAIISNSRHSTNRERQQMVRSFAH